VDINVWRFTAWCTIVQSAVLRLHVVRPSVCLSVRPSVMLVDQDHIRWKSWKLIAQTISPTPALFLAQRPSTYSQGTWGILGRLEVRWGKVACWSTKAAISPKRVKIDEKLLWRAYRNLPNALSNGTIPDPLRPPFPQDWFAKTAIAIISGIQIWQVCSQSHLNKSPWKIWEKRERGRI